MLVHVVEPGLPPPPDAANDNRVYVGDGVGDIDDDGVGDD